MWDPWRNGATKVYAFAGRFSYALPTAVAAMAFNSITSVTTVNFDPVGRRDPTCAAPPEHRRDAGPYGDSVDAGLKASSMDELTLGIERLIGPALTVGVKGTYRSLNDVVEDRCDFDYNVRETQLLRPHQPGFGPDLRAETRQPAMASALWPTPCALQWPAVARRQSGSTAASSFSRASLGNELWLQASYVHSSLRGNYDGGVNEASGQTRPG